MYKPDDLPPKVDLRPWMTPVEDQSDLNSWYVLKQVLEGKTSPKYLKTKIHKTDEGMFLTVQRWLNEVICP